MATQVIERSTLVEVTTLAADVRNEVGKAFLGGAEPIELILTTLMARGHVLLEGVPGIAKTTLVKAFAAALGCSFRRIQFTPDLLPSDITGTYVLQAGTFALREGPIFAQVILADEINRAPAKTQSALLEAMQERQVTIEGQTRALEPPFFVLATQNPIEHEGTYPLPEAQVDRFLAKLRMGYPVHGDEREMLRRYASAPDRESSRETRRVLEPATILRLQELADAVHVEDELLDYVIALAQFTRTHRRVALGASPRAALQLVHAAKARALLGGRDFVLPDDVKQLAPYVMPHRVLLSADAELEGLGSDAIVKEALDRVAYRGKPRG
ncbi:MAG TPA: MoxR family ATPase [Polyangia bacterium]|nr:MoxR family ATPase [Polyangia bacterium]